jgi:glutathione S-transferase
VVSFFAPFLERIAASLTYYKGFCIRNNPTLPHIERWFAAMEQRPTFLHIKVRSNSSLSTFSLQPVPLTSRLVLV